MRQLDEAVANAKERTRLDRMRRIAEAKVLSERIKELLAGTPATVAVKLHGESLDDLDRAVQDVAAALKAVPGNADVRIEAQTGVPEVVVRLRGVDLARFGLRRLPVLEAVQTACTAIEAHFGRPNHTGYANFQLKLIAAASAPQGAAVWRKALSDHWANCPAETKDK